MRFDDVSANHLSDQILAAAKAAARAELVWLAARANAADALASGSVDGTESEQARLTSLAGASPNDSSFSSALCRCAGIDATGEQVVVAAPAELADQLIGDACGPSLVGFVTGSFGARVDVDGSLWWFGVLDRALAEMWHLTASFAADPWSAVAVAELLAEDWCEGVEDLTAAAVLLSD